MTNFKIFAIIAFLSVFSACEKNDVFTGSPVGTSIDFVDLFCAISSSTTASVSGQKIPVTITLPQLFDVDVSVQVTSFLPETNKRVTSTLIIPKGLISFTGLIASPPIDDSELKFILKANYFVSAIGTSPSLLPVSGFKGIQYRASSNTLVLDWGDTAIPAVNSNRLGVRFDYENPRYIVIPSYNDLDIVVKKTNGTVIQNVLSGGTIPINGTPTNNNPASRYENVNFLSSAPNDTYTVSVFAKTLKTPSLNLPYRFAVRFPNEASISFSGVLNGLTVGSVATAIPKLRIVKTTNTTTGLPEFEVTEIP